MPFNANIGRMSVLSDDTCKVCSVSVTLPLMVEHGYFEQATN